MPLSSNSLIHFTQEKDNLIGILNDNFKVHYCYEKICSRYSFLSGAMPMVCFCDIPLSEIKEHIKIYGCYGIGLKKEWAIQNGLNPVFYCEKESNISTEVQTIFDGIAKGDFHAHAKIKQSLLNMIRLMKNYQGEFHRNGEIYYNYRYSDEREWRFVPSYQEATLVSGLQFVTEEQKRIANDLIRDLRLCFTPDDITYIIIKEESEIKEFIKILREAKGKYSYDQVDRLTTRIITTEQIRSDF